MKYLTEVTTRKTLEIDPKSIPAIRAAIELGEKVYFTNCATDRDNIIFDGGLDYSKRHLVVGIAEKQAKGKGFIKYKGEMFQYACIRKYQ